MLREEGERVDVYAVKSGDLPGKDLGKEKGKRKVEDSCDEPKRPRKEPRFTSYTELNETLE